MDIAKELLSMQDTEYREFHSRLMPTVDKERIIGIRTPSLRAFAKKIKGTKEAEDFMSDLPHRYYEENNLHGMMIDYIKDEKEQAEALDKFLPYVDNWATCDLMRPKALFKSPDLLLEKIGKWIKSDKTYAVRFAIGMLLVRFLDEDFDKKYLDMVCFVKSEEYYIKMMQAWYFATALAKQYGSTIGYITENRLDVWTHNKTIQKAVESYRIDDKTKALLKTKKR